MHNLKLSSFFGQLYLPLTQCMHISSVTILTHSHKILAFLKYDSQNTSVSVSDLNKNMEFYVIIIITINSSLHQTVTTTKVWPYI